MSRRDAVVFCVLGLLLGAVVVAEMLAPEPLDWRPNYRADATEPYGSRVLFEQLPAVVPEAEVTAAERPPYLMLRDTTRPPHTYAFITPFFSPDPVVEDALLAFAARGNTVFIASDLLGDSLDAALDVTTAYRASGAVEVDSTVGIRFTASNLSAYALTLDAYMVEAHIAAFDTARTTVLAETAEGEVVFARIEVDEGEVLLTTLPLAFTNYALLSTTDAAAFAWNALAYLPPDQLLVWDTQYKPGRTVATSPLRYVLSDRALRGAVYLTLLGIVLFMLFEAKRRQRPIPVVKPPRNETLAFVRTVGDLYYQRGDHADLAEKKIRYFLEHVRDQYRLSTGALDDAFVHRLAERSGVDEAELRALLERVARLEGRSTVALDELIDLHDRIEAFHRTARSGQRRPALSTSSLS